MLFTSCKTQLHKYNGRCGGRGAWGRAMARNSNLIGRSSGGSHRKQNDTLLAAMFPVRHESAAASQCKRVSLLAHLYVLEALSRAGTSDRPQ